MGWESVHLARRRCSCGRTRPACCTPAGARAPPRCMPRRSHRAMAAHHGSLHPAVGQHHARVSAFAATMTWSASNVAEQKERDSAQISTESQQIE